MKTETPNLKPAAGHMSANDLIDDAINTIEGLELEAKHSGQSDCIPYACRCLNQAKTQNAELVKVLELFVFLDDDAELDMAEFQKLRDIAFQKARAILATEKKQVDLPAGRA